MDAVEYLKILARMHYKQEDCAHCVLPNGCDITKDEKEIENRVEIIEQWAKDNPIKTRQSEFLKQFPNARLKEGVLIIDPCKIDITSKEDDKCEALKTGMYSCSDCRKKYWFTEVD